MPRERIHSLKLWLWDNDRDVKMGEDDSFFAYTLRAFAESPVERTLVFRIVIDDDSEIDSSVALFTSDIIDELMESRGSRPERVGSGAVAVNLFDGASNTGFLQIADAFDDMKSMLAVVQQIAWTFAVTFLQGHWARFAEPDRARHEIFVAVGEIARQEFGDRFG